MKANQSPDRIKYNFDENKRPSYKIFPEEKIVLVEVHEFCDYFRSARFFLYSLAGLRELSRITFFDGYFLSSDRRKTANPK